jgi:hypothetical protein
MLKDKGLEGPMKHQNKGPQEMQHRDPVKLMKHRIRGLRQMQDRDPGEQMQHQSKELQEMQGT